MMENPRIDWRLCRQQTMVYAAAGLIYSTFPVAIAGLGTAKLLGGGFTAGLLYRITLLLSMAFAVWFICGLLLSAAAQWLHATPEGSLWRGAPLVAAAAAFHGPANRFLVIQFVPADAALPIPANIFMFWLTSFCGGLFFGYCVLVQRSRHRNNLLVNAEIERASAEAQLRETRMHALEERMDPALLEHTLGALRGTYAHDRAAGEELLGALVEALRSAVPSAQEATIRNGISSTPRAWTNLRARLETLSVNPEETPDEKLRP